jgi:hypothetical protein
MFQKINPFKPSNPSNPSSSYPGTSPENAKRLRFADPLSFFPRSKSLRRKWLHQSSPVDHGFVDLLDGLICLMDIFVLDNTKNRWL